MAGKGTIRVRIAVAVNIHGDWIAYGSSCPSVANDTCDTRNRWWAADALRNRDVQAPYRINMVEADVILPMLENKEVVVPADE